MIAITVQQLTYPEPWLWGESSWTTPQPANLDYVDLAGGLDPWVADLIDFLGLERYADVRILVNGQVLAEVPLSEDTPEPDSYWDA